MQQRLKNRKLLVLAETLYEDLELWYPVLRFREEGAQVTVAGMGEQTYHGKHGYPVNVDASLLELSGNDFDAVIIPGGYAPDHMRRHPFLLRFVRDMHDQGKLVAAICHAAWVPISAGIVKGRRATCYLSIKDDVINAGGLYEDAELVEDGNLITSRQQEDLGAFCRAIIRNLTND